MKIAILIAGEFREFEICIKSWTFKNWDNVDFYFSTWNISREINLKLGINLHEDVTIEKIQKHIKVVDYAIDPTKLLLKNTYYMLDRWKRGLKLIQDSNIFYDVIIIIRPDLYLNFNDNLLKTFIKNIKDNTFYTTSVNNCMVIGKFATMLKLIDIKEYLCNNITTLHWFLNEQLLSITKNIEIMPFYEYVLCRSTCRNISLNFDIVKQKDEEWPTAFKSRNYKNFPDYFENIIETKIDDLNSRIEILDTTYGKIIRKTGNIEQTYNQLRNLKINGYLVPNILNKTWNSIDIEYIDGIDITPYLK